MFTQMFRGPLHFLKIKLWGKKLFFSITGTMGNRQYNEQNKKKKLDYGLGLNTCGYVMKHLHIFWA